MTNELGISVAGYDVFDELVNFWQQILKDSNKLAKAILKWSPEKETYRIVKSELKNHWTGKKKIRSKARLAACYWYNHNLSYGQGFLGWMSKIYECPTRYAKLVE